MGVGWVGNRPVPLEGQWRAPGSLECGGRVLGLRHLEHLEPLLDLALGFVPFDAVALLDLPRELVAPSFDDLHVIVGEPAPLLASLPLELLPAAFDPVPVHRCLRWHPIGRHDLDCEQSQRIGPKTLPVGNGSGFDVLVPSTCSLLPASRAARANIHGVGTQQWVTLSAPAALRVSCATSIRSLCA